MRARIKYHLQNFNLQVCGIITYPKLELGVDTECIALNADLRSVGIVER